MVQGAGYGVDLGVEKWSKGVLEYWSIGKKPKVGVIDYAEE
jgi:hypothetical protein